MAGKEAVTAHPIRLNRLWQLRRMMVEAGIRRNSFSYRANKATLQVAYLIDCEPNELIIGVEGVRTYAFPVVVTADCTVTPFLGEHYGPLLDALGVEKGVKKFSTLSFFRELDGFVPNLPSPRVFQAAQLVARVHHDVEEADKIYFRGWVTHSDGRHVTSENLHKTERLLGLAAAESCRRNNTSSRWSADYRDNREITPPPSGSSQRDSVGPL